MNISIKPTKAFIGFPSINITVQEHERGRMQLRQNDYLQGEKEIRKEISDFSYLYNIHKVILFTKYTSHLTIPSQCACLLAVIKGIGIRFQRNEIGSNRNSLRHRQLWPCRRCYS